jgi:uncharacterized protein YkwD
MEVRRLFVIAAASAVACTGEVTGWERVDGLSVDGRAGDDGAVGVADAAARDAAIPDAAAGDDLLEALSEDERRTFAAINAARSEHGLSAVGLRADLICAARRHADDIGPREVCTHLGSDGSDADGRVAACGGPGWSNEIVSCGYDSPEGAVDGWLSSLSHRYALLRPEQRVVGVGSNNDYRTAVFDR